MSVSSSRAVSMSTGTGRSAWIRRQTSSPSMPGSITSRTTTSGRSRDAALTPASPSAADSTVQPSAESRCTIACAIAGSSSTTRTVVPAAPPGDVFTFAMPSAWHRVARMTPERGPSSLRERSDHPYDGAHHEQLK